MDLQMFICLQIFVSERRKVVDSHVRDMRGWHNLLPDLCPLAKSYTLVLESSGGWLKGEAKETSHRVFSETGQQHCYSFQVLDSAELRQC